MRQSRHGVKNDDDKLWKIPIGYVTSTGKEGMFVLEAKEAEVKIELEEGETVKFNSEQKGFFLVTLEEEQFKQWMESRAKYSSMNTYGQYVNDRIYEITTQKQLMEDEY